MNPTYISFKNPARDAHFHAILRADTISGDPAAYAAGDVQTWRLMDYQENKLSLVQTIGERSLVFCPAAGFAWVFSDALKKWKPKP